MKPALPIFIRFGSRLSAFLGCALVSSAPAQVRIAPDVPAAADFRGWQRSGTLTVLTTPEGADLPTLVAATGWQAHSVRGALSGTLKARRGLAIASERTPAGRLYRIVQG